MGMPCEFLDEDDDGVTVVIKGKDRATLETIFSKLGIQESNITDDDGNRVTFSEYDFEFQFLRDWDGPFEWILEIAFSEEDMEFREWYYLRAVAEALAEKLGGKHESDRTGEEVLEEGHLWAPPPPIKSP
jgi:hypothetical protein